MEGSGGGKHFILVHGLCHGAWCWYKLVPMLRAAGHRVTALDMAASGAHPARMDEVASFEDYSRPLLDAVAAAPAGERLVLVGHSLGGLNIALAMERFPRKVAAAVFVAACMPCVGRHMGGTTEEIMRRIKPDFFMDMKRMALNTSQGPRPALVFGPKLLAAKLYDRSSAEDQTLATMLVRPGCQFLDDPTMEDEALLTDANYGSVKKVYVVAMADASNSEAMQRWMVDLSPGTEAEEIAGADHMAMCSKPRELCDVLLRITDNLGKGESIRTPDRTAISIKVLATNFMRATIPNQPVRKRDDMWKKPTSGRVKINVDAAFCAENMAGATGAVARDDRGEFIAAASWFISHVTSADSAEVNAIRNGLLLAMNIGCTSLIVELDNVNAVEIINQEDYQGHDVAIYMECKHLGPISLMLM